MPSPGAPKEDTGRAVTIAAAGVAEGCDDASCRVVAQEAGELLFVPSGWYHQVACEVAGGAPRRAPRRAHLPCFVRAPCVTCHVPAVAQVISILIPMPVSLSVSLWLRFPSVFKWH